MKSSKISERITIAEDKSLLKIEITQKIEPTKMMLLYLWLVCWLFCGIVFIYYLIQEPDSSQKLYFGVLVGGWAFIFFRILRVTIWRIIGKEIIQVDASNVSIKNAYGTLGKTLNFGRQHVQNIRQVKDDKNTFFRFMENSFWIMGNNKFEFKFMGKTYQFGKQLNPVEVKSMKRILEKAWRK